MNNTFWSVEDSGRNQEQRDDTVSNWKVYMPYVLFSRRHYMEGMPAPRGQRWTKMVVYTQVQRAMFEVVRIPAGDVDGHSNPRSYPFDRQVREWNIRVPEETKKEFQKYNESDPQ